MYERGRKTIYLLPILEPIFNSGLHFKFEIHSIPGSAPIPGATSDFGIHSIPRSTSDSATHFRFRDPLNSDSAIYFNFRSHVHSGLYFKSRINWSSFCANFCLVDAKSAGVLFSICSPDSIFPLAHGGTPSNFHRNRIVFARRQRFFAGR